MYPENLHVLPQLFLQHDAGSLFQIKVPWPIHLAMYSLQEVQEYTKYWKGARDRLCMDRLSMDRISMDRVSMDNLSMDMSGFLDTAQTPSSVIYV